MLSSRPTHKKFPARELPPKLMKGRVIPVTGMMPMAIPTLSRIWKKNITTMPVASMVPNGSLALAAILKALQMSIEKSASSIMPPMKPSSSPTTEKMKSVWCAGMMLSTFIADRRMEIKSNKEFLQALAIAVIPMFFIFFEPDLGVTISVLVIFIGMMLVGGASLRQIAVLVVLSLIHISE